MITSASQLEKLFSLYARFTLIIQWSYQLNSLAIYHLLYHNIIYVILILLYWQQLAYALHSVLISSFFNTHYKLWIWISDIIIMTIRKLTPLLCFLGKSTYAAGGMHVVIKGRQATRKEAPILVIAPHSTFLDGGIVYATGFPSIIVRRESGTNPYIGSTFNSLFIFFLLLNWMLLMFYYIYTPLTILVCLIKGNNRRQFQ